MMSQFTTFSYFDGARRTAIRLSDDGRASLLITARHGEVVHNVETVVDSAAASELVLDAAMLTPDLRDTGGDFAIGFGEGEGQPTIWSMQEHDMPLEAMVFAQRMRELSADIARTRATEIYDQPRYKDSPAVGMTPADFVIWSVAFFCGQLAASIAGLIALGFLVKAASLAGLVAGVLVTAALIGLAYFTIGRMHGAKFGTAADVWKPAAAAVVIPAVVTALAGGSFTLGLGLVFPLIARWGAGTTT